MSALICGHTYALLWLHTPWPQPKREPSFAICACMSVRWHEPTAVGMRFLFNWWNSSSAKQAKGKPVKSDVWNKRRMFKCFLVLWWKKVLLFTSVQLKDVVSDSQVDRVPKQSTHPSAHPSYSHSFFPFYMLCATQHLNLLICNPSN